MDLRQLNALLAIAEHGSFSAAAKALHTVQSNVSAHVARLEKELGTELVDRAAGELTPAGEAVAARARHIQQELAALDSDLAALQDRITGSVRCGIIGTTARWLAPPLLRSAATELPDVQIVLVDATTTSLVPALLQGRIDLAVVNLPLATPELLVEPLFEEDSLLVVPPEHPLFARRSVDLATLAEHELLLEPAGTGFRDDLDRAARAAGVTLRPQAEIDGMRLLASLAFTGFGAAVLPASAAPGWVGGEWRRIPITDLAGRTVGLARARHTRPSAAVAAVQGLLFEVVAKHAAQQPGIRPLDRVVET
jgi:LysR family hydrogen peroxide-inducible transcriptional activator